MGMFDYIEYSAPCPKCNTIITDWQSKDAECMLNTLSPNKVLYFYASCHSCGVWIDAEVTHKDYDVNLKIDNTRKINIKNPMHEINEI